MPRIKKATDAQGTVFYPVSISKAIWDTDNNQRLSATLGNIFPKVTAISLDPDTGALSITIDDGTSSS